MSALPISSSSPFYRLDPSSPGFQPSGGQQTQLPMNYQSAPFNPHAGGSGSIFQGGGSQGLLPLLFSLLGGGGLFGNMNQPQPVPMSMPWNMQGGSGGIQENSQIKNLLPLFQLLSGLGGGFGGMNNPQAAPQITRPWSEQIPQSFSTVPQSRGSSARGGYTRGGPAGGSSIY